MERATSTMAFPDQSTRSSAARATRAPCRRDADSIQGRREFDRLVGRTYSRAFGVARAVLHDSAAAEDATQDAFVRAWKGFGTYDPHVPFEAWMLRIVRNTAIDRYRGRGREFERVVQLSPDEISRLGVDDCRAAEAAADPEEQLLSREFGAELDTAVRSLPARYRQIIQLVDIDRNTYAEAAELAHCPIGSVRSRVHRARRLLRVALQNGPADPDFRA